VFELIKNMHAAGTDCDPRRPWHRPRPQGTATGATGTRGNCQRL